MLTNSDFIKKLTNALYNNQNICFTNTCDEVVVNIYRLIESPVIHKTGIMSCA